MCGGPPIKSRSPEQIIATAMLIDLGAPVDPAKVAEFVGRRWDQLAPLCHQLHRRYMRNRSCEGAGAPVFSP